MAIYYPDKNELQMRLNKLILQALPKSLDSLNIVKEVELPNNPFFLENINQALFGDIGIDVFVKACNQYVPFENHQADFVLKEHAPLRMRLDAIELVFEYSDEMRGYIPAKCAYAKMDSNAALRVIDLQLHKLAYACIQAVSNRHTCHQKLLLANLQQTAMPEVDSCVSNILNVLDNLPLDVNMDLLIKNIDHTLDLICQSAKTMCQNIANDHRSRAKLLNQHKQKLSHSWHGFKANMPATSKEMQDCRENKEFWEQEANKVEFAIGPLVIQSFKQVGEKIKQSPRNKACVLWMLNQEYEKRQMDPNIEILPQDMVKLIYLQYLRENQNNVVSIETKEQGRPVLK